MFAYPHSRNRCLVEISKPHTSLTPVIHTSKYQGEGGVPDYLFWATLSFLFSFILPKKKNWNNKNFPLFSHEDWIGLKTKVNWLGLLLFCQQHPPLIYPIQILRKGFPFSPPSKKWFQISFLFNSYFTNYWHALLAEFKSEGLLSAVIKNVFTRDYWHSLLAGDMTYLTSSICRLIWLYALMCPKLGLSHRLVSKNRVMKLDEQFLTQELGHSMSWVFETWVQLSSLWVNFYKKQHTLVA